MAENLFHPGTRILFLGDSITDCGRDRSDSSSLGNGYVKLIAEAVPDAVVINRGVSGNRIYDLEARWTEDCLDLAPDVISVLIGINDTWRRYDSGLVSPIDEFEACYRRLLDQARHNTQSTVILMEPFLLPIPPDRARWREDLDPRIHAVRRVATDERCRLVPLDGLFAAESAWIAPEVLAEDGVHPNAAGHALIARSWLASIP